MRFIKMLLAISALLIPVGAYAAGNPTSISLQCEEALALSALPKRLRDQASVYVLADGAFRQSRKSDGPFTCIVERNHERALIPQCTDAAGADSVIPGIMKKSLWSLGGATPQERQEHFDQAVQRGQLQPPARPGVAYMMSAFNYSWSWQNDDYAVIPPHVMFYAPGLENADIGGSMREGMGTNRGVPFIIEAGIHGYAVSMVEHASDSADVQNACAGELPAAADSLGQGRDDRIDAAIGSALRTADDRLLDASRKPRQFLEFLDIEDGDHVAEINAGAGYNVRLLATMVGDSGHVYATNAEFVRGLFDGINERLAKSVEGAANVSVGTHPSDRLVIDGELDVALLSFIYHDLHWQEIDTARFNQSVFDALKPGGVFVVADHAAIDGSGTSQAATIHRIDRDTVVREIEAAGFELLASANFLENPRDDRTLFVIDPAIRGKTDRFLLKFRRP